MLLRRRVKINVIDEAGEKQRVLEGGRMFLPRRLVRLLFGDGMMKILVITPGTCVDHVVVSEIGKGGNKVETR